MLRLCIRTMVLTLAITLPVSAHAASSSHRQAVDRLFQLTNMEQKIGDSVDTILQLQLRQNPQLVEHRELLRKFLEKHIGWASMKEQLAAMYMSTFTEKELNEINAFYITPTGQRVIADVPKLVQKRNELALERMRANIGELQQLLKDKGTQ